jgi:hypothetical protein
MYAILYAFLLWHTDWASGRVRIACNNSAVVDTIRKRSIVGLAIRPLQTILLIAPLFDIEIIPFCIPSEENIVADAVYGDRANRLRLPLTSHLLARIVAQARSDLDGISIGTALCVAFAGFLRLGEFTWNPWDLDTSSTHCISHRHAASLYFSRCFASLFSDVLCALFRMSFHGLNSLDLY